MTAGESLYVVIGAQVDPLIKGLKDAENSLKDFGRSTQSVMRQVESAAGAFETLFGVGLTAGLAYFTRSTIENISHLEDQANQLGINVEKLQAMQFAATQAGVNTEEFNDGMNRLSRELGQAQAGVVKAQDSFARWGVAIRDGSGKALNLEQVLNNVADRMQSIVDPNLRAAAATELLGKNAYALINFLSQGSAAMAEMEKKAVSMGAVLGESVVKNFKETNDKIEASSQIIKVNFAEALNNVMPLLQKFSDLLNTASQAGKGLSLLKNLWVNQITSLSQGGGDPVQTFKDTMKQMEDAQNNSQSTPLKMTIHPMQQGGFQPGNPEATRALDNYLIKLQQLHDMNSLTERDQAIQKAVDDAETIARNNNVKATDDYITKVREAAAANYDQVQAIQQVKEVAKGLAESFSDGMKDMVLNGKKFSDVLKDIESDIVSLLMKVAIEKPLENGLTGMLGGGSSSGGGVTGGITDFIGSFFKASGGPVSGSQPYIVGEQGPELFVPNSSGSIVPNGDLGGSGGRVTIVQNLNFSTGVQATVRSEVMNMLPQIANASAAAVADMKRRGGSYARSLSG